MTTSSQKKEKLEKKIHHTHTHTRQQQRKAVSNEKHLTSHTLDRSKYVEQNKKRRKKTEVIYELRRYRPALVELDK